MALISDDLGEKSDNTRDTSTEAKSRMALFAQEVSKGVLTSKLTVVGASHIIGSAHNTVS